MTPATGLAGAVAIASTAARTSLSRRAAASAAIATASPRANVSRPIATLTTVPAANSRLAASARGCPRTRSWKHQAARTQLAMATAGAPSTAPSTGNSTPYAGVW